MVEVGSAHSSDVCKVSGGAHGALSGRGPSTSNGTGAREVGSKVHEGSWILRYLQRGRSFTLSLGKALSL